MKQVSLATTGFELVTKRKRKRAFRDEMNLFVPWRELVGLIQPFAPTGTAVDADSGLLHTVIGTAANVNDVTQGHGSLHGEEAVVFADAGYQGRAPVSRDQVPVRLHQGPLQRAGQEFDEKAQRVSWDELLNLNSRCGGGYADLPWPFARAGWGLCLE